MVHRWVPTYKHLLRYRNCRLLVCVWCSYLRTYAQLNKEQRRYRRNFHDTDSSNDQRSKITHELFMKHLLTYLFIYFTLRSPNPNPSHQDVLLDSLRVTLHLVPLPLRSCSFIVSVGTPLSVKRDFLDEDYSLWWGMEISLYPIFRPESLSLTRMSVPVPGCYHSS